MSSPWSNQLTGLVVISASVGGFSGFFVYSPAPGFGNLIASVTASSGTDPYGNAYLQGFTTYNIGSPNSFAESLNGGDTLFYSATSAAGPWTQAIQMSLVAGIPASDSLLLLTGLGIQSSPNGAWQQATLEPGFSASGSGVNGLWWRIIPSPSNTLEIIADITNAGAGTSTCAVISGPQPNSNSNHPAGWSNPAANNSATVPWVSITSGSGETIVTITSMEAFPKEIFFHIFVPLDTF